MKQHSLLASPHPLPSSRVRPSVLLSLVFAALLSNGLTASAQTDQIKTNNTANLTSGTSWVSGTAPGALDTATWDSTVTGANSISLGSDTNFGQIQILNPGGSVTINSGNTLTLSGVSGTGIDMSAATRDLTLNNAVVVGANQNWFVKNNPAPHNDVAGTHLYVTGTVSIAAGVTLTIGPVSPGPAGYVNWTANNSATIVPGSQIIINAQNNADSPDNHSGGLSINDPTQLGSASITVNSNASLYIRDAGLYTYSQTITNNGGIIYNLTTGSGTTTFIGNPAIVTGDANNPAKFTGDYGLDKQWYMFGQITGPGGIQLIQPPSRSGMAGQCCNNPGSWFVLDNSTNNYAGNTTVVNGALENGASDVIPNGIGAGNVVLYATNTANLLNGSSYWFMSGYNETINGLSDGGNGNGRVTSGHPSGSSAASAGGSGTSTLTLGDNNATASFKGILENNGTLNLVKIGAGMQTLSGINTYTGTTTISNGMLRITGQLANTALSIYGGALSGNGSVLGPVTAYAGGVIQPGIGLGVGRLAISNDVILDPASTNLFMASALTNTQLQVQGNLTPNNSVITVDLGGAYLGAGTNVLITYSGTETGNFSPVPNIINGSAGVATIDETVPGQVRLIINYFATSADHLAILTQPSAAAVAGSVFAQQPVVELLNPDNSVATGNSSSYVTAAIVSGGVLQGTVINQAVNGVVDFSASGLFATNAGAITLSFSAVLTNGLTTVNSSVINVTPAAAAKLAIQTQPSANATVTVPFSSQPVVAVQDTYGNVITTDNSTVVTAAATTANANLSGPVSATVVNGVATFSGLYLTNAVVNSLNFTSLPSYLAAQSSNINVVGGSPATLVIGTAPSPTAAVGVVFSTQPVIKMLDALGNISPTNATITVTSSVGTVQGTTTITAVNGTATFSGLSLTNAGSVTLTFASPGLNSTNASVTVGAGPAVALLWTTQPANAVNGQPFGTQPVIKTTDAYGNPSTNGLSSTNTLTVSLQSGGGVLTGQASYNIGTGTGGSNGVVTFSGLGITAAGNGDQLLASVVTGSAPTNIPSCVLWLDASDTNTLTLSGAAITTWKDKSGTANNATLGTAPTFATNVNFFASTPGFGRAARFDGSSTYLKVNLNSLNGSPYTVIAMEINNSPSGQSHYLGTDPSGQDHALQVGYNNGNSQVILGQYSDDFTLNGSFTAGVPRSWASVHQSGGGGQIYLNGTSLGTSGSPANYLTGATQGYVGASFNHGAHYKGDLAEIIVYTSALSVAQVTSLNSYLNSKWVAGISVASSAPFNVQPAPATQLVFSNAPTTTVAGATLANVVVQMLDVNGNPTSGAGTNVTVTLTSGTGTLLGTLTQATAANGQATFNDLSLTNAGPFGLQASAAGLTATATAPFTINPAAASQVVFVQGPSAVTSGNIMTPALTVQIQDQYGNNRSDSGTNITITVASGSVSLSGTTSATTVGGVATFNNLIVNGGSQSPTLQANASPLTAGVSASFALTGASVDSVAFTAQPVDTLAGAVMAEVDVRATYMGTPATGVTVILTLSSGTGPLNGTLSEVTDANGVAHFANLSLTSAGMKHLQAAFGLVTTNSLSFSILPATGTTLAFTTQPSDSTAGVAISPAVVVQVQDLYGNNVSSSAVPVSLTLNGSGALSGMTPQNTDPTGKAVFNDLSVNLAGSKTVSATASGFSAITSSAFSITNAAASSLGIVINAPATAMAGVAFTNSPTVAVQDAFGNVVSNSAASITVTASVGTIQGTAVRTASAGQAAFSGLSLTNVGNVTLTFASAGLSSTSSSVITVSAGPATKLVWTTQPGSQLEGQPFGSGSSTAPVLGMADQYGHLSTSALAANVYVTVSPAETVGPLLASSGRQTYNIGTAGGNGVVTVSNLNIAAVGSGNQLLAWVNTGGVLPGDISSGTLQVWLDGADTNFITFNGANISSWNDKSGHGLSASQPSSGSQPTYHSESALLPGGGNTGNVLGFNGSSQILSNLNITSLANTPYAIFSVVARTAQVSGANFYLGNQADGVADHAFITGYNADNSYLAVQYGDNGPVVGVPAYTTETFNVFAQYWVSPTAPSTVTIQKNGNVLGSGTINHFLSSSSAHLNNGDVGGWDQNTPVIHFTGDMAEVLVYTGVLSATDITNVNNYLMSKWTVTPAISQALSSPFTVNPALVSETNSIVGISNNNNGTFTIQFVGTTGVSYYVQSTTNLAPPVVWSAVTGSTNLVVNMDGTWSAVITNSMPIQFFRSAVTNP